MQIHFNHLGISSKEIIFGSPESDVLSELQNSETKMTIAQLVAKQNKFGAHTLFEKPRKKTTVRKMYQIIRNLRELGCPIVGDSKGLRIAETEEEIESFARHLETKAKSDIQSMMHLRKSMLGMINSETPSLFDSLI